MRVHAFIARAPALWLRAHGGLPEGVDEAELNSPDGVSRETQALMLREVALRGREAALLSLGGPLAQATDQPLLFVMLNSRDVADFLDKEQRFNRFFHSEHRLRVLAREERGIELEHTGLSRPPDRVESLFVLGLHLAMFRELGCEGLEATLPGSELPTEPVFAGSKARSTLPRGGHTRWRITWRDFRARREPFPGLDEMLVAGAAPLDLEVETDLVTRVARRLRSDLVHRWNVSEVAKALGTSARSLQRGLADARTSFSQVLDAVRVEAAAEALRDPARSITEIGYVCGFSDSAHFSRRFRARMGVTPGAFRARL